MENAFAMAALLLAFGTASAQTGKDTVSMKRENTGTEVRKNEQPSIMQDKKKQSAKTKGQKSGNTSKNMPAGSPEGTPPTGTRTQPGTTPTDPNTPSR